MDKQILEHANALFTRKFHRSVSRDDPTVERCTFYAVREPIPKYPFHLIAFSGRRVIPCSRHEPLNQVPKLRSRPRPVLCVLAGRFVRN
jgi:hypothetical protein